MKVVKLLDQASEDGPRDSLREQVGDHHDAGEVFDGDDTTADEIAKELGGTQDVLGLLEDDGTDRDHSPNTGASPKASPVAARSKRKGLLGGIRNRSKTG